MLGLSLIRKAFYQTIYSPLKRILPSSHPERRLFILYNSCILARGQLQHSSLFPKRIVHLDICLPSYTKLCTSESLPSALSPSQYCHLKAQCFFPNTHRRLWSLAQCFLFLRPFMDDHINYASEFLDFLKGNDLHFFCTSALYFHGNTEPVFTQKYFDFENLNSNVRL